MTRLALAVAAALATVGCTVDGHQARSAAPPPTPSNGNGWPDTEWWRTFDSPQLVAVVVQAQEDNPDIAAAVARIEQARALLRVARAPLLPAVAVSGSVTRQGANASSGAISGNFAYAEVSASWEADIWGRLRAQARSARARYASSRFDADAVRLAVEAQAAASWLTIAEIDQRRAIASADLAASRSLDEQAGARVASGEALPGEAAAQRIITSDVEAQLAELDRVRADAVSSLAVLLGQSARSFVVETIDAKTIATPSQPSADLDSWLLTRRPDIAASEAELAAAGEDVAAARAAMLPRISLGASGGGQIGTGPSEALYNLIAGLAQPLFDHGTLAGQRDFAVGARNERAANYRGVVLGALRDVQKTMIAMGQLDQEVAARAAAVQQAQQLLAQARTRQRLGSETMATVLDAEREWYARRAMLEATRFERLRASVALFDALGGGWQNDSCCRKRPFKVQCANVRAWSRAFKACS